MKLARFNLYRYRLPFYRPLTLAGATHFQREDILLKLSSAYESGVGMAALVALAAGIGDSPVPVGLDPYRAMAEDALETPLDLPAPEVDVRETTDASRTVDVRRLERL